MCWPQLSSLPHTSPHVDFGSGRPQRHWYEFLPHGHAVGADMATHSGQAPGWHCSVHLWGQPCPRGRSHVSPHECGVKNPSGGGSTRFPQKHLYAVGMLSTVVWHDGQRNERPSPLPSDFAHFFTQPM